MCPCHFLLPPGILVVVDACLVLSLTWKSTPRVRSSSLYIPEADSRVATLLLIVHASPKVGLIYDTISVGTRYSFLHVSGISVENNRVHVVLAMFCNSKTTREQAGSRGHTQVNPCKAKICFAIGTWRLVSRKSEGGRRER